MVMRMKKNQGYILIAAMLFLLGFVMGKRTEQRQKIKPEEALKQVREYYKEKYEVSGSWIYMKSEQLQKNGLDYEVYHGGITRKENGKSYPYEFYLDAYTGTILEIHPSATPVFH